MAFSNIVDIPLLQLFGEGTIVPLKKAVNSLANAIGAMADAEVTTDKGVHGIRYYNGDLEYSITSYTEVTPIGNENPQSLSWYEYVSGEYVLTTDTEVIAGKNYYSSVLTWYSINSTPFIDL